MKNVIIPDNVKIVMKILSNHGFKSFVVGGAVRNSILDIPVKDWDIATDALPNEILEIFIPSFTVIPTGIAHGTVTTIVFGDAIDVTTFRADVGSSDGRHPDSVAFVREITRDLARRDFTINAMAFNQEKGLIDPFGGQDDLNNKIIRAVGDPDARFKEDALRILRAFRFACTLGFQIELQTMVSLTWRKKGILNLSAERVRDEFVKIITSNDVSIINDMISSGVMGLIIRDIELIFACPQHNIHHCMNVGDHTLFAMANSSDNSVVLRLALFFHDFGKLATISRGEDGFDHFHGHAVESVRLARHHMEVLKFDNATIDKVTKLISLHDAQIQPTKKSVRRLLSVLGTDDFELWLKMRIADISAHVQDDNTSGQILKLMEIRTIGFRLIEEKDCFTLKDLTVNGNDIIAMGFKGRIIGQILNDVLQLVIDEELKNDADEIKTFVKNNF